MDVRRHRNPCTGSLSFQNAAAWGKSRNSDGPPDEYARSRDCGREAVPNGCRLLFLGSRPIISRESRGQAALFWRYRLADHRLRIPLTGAPGDETAAAETQLQRAVTLLETASRESVDSAVFRKGLDALFGNRAARAWKVLCTGGLVCRKARV